jgi:hypothetical protein
MHHLWIDLEGHVDTRRLCLFGNAPERRQ